MATQEGFVDIKFALALDLARMGLWPGDVRFTDRSDATEPTGDDVDRAVEAWERDRARAEEQPDFAYETPEEQYADPAYEAYEAWLAGLCNASYVTGPAHDPYGTYCDLQQGHDGKHEGDDPFGNGGRVRWNGGGSIAGDPVRATDVEYVEVPR